MLDAQGLAFRQVLSLMIAQRAPSRYLRPGNPDLERLTDSYLRLLAANGIISPSLRDAALKATRELNRAPAGAQDRYRSSRARPSTSMRRICSPRSA